MSPKFTRVAVPVGWAVISYFAFLAAGPEALVLGMRVAFGLLLALHLVELAVLAARLRRAGEPILASDFAGTLVFGIFHVGPRLAPLRRRGA